MVRSGRDMCKCAIEFVYIYYIYMVLLMKRCDIL
jgi:hypothetical protein